MNVLLGSFLNSVSARTKHARQAHGDLCSKFSILEAIMSNYSLLGKGPDHYKIVSSRLVALQVWLRLMEQLHSNKTLHLTLS